MTEEKTERKKNWLRALAWTAILAVALAAGCHRVEPHLVETDGKIVCIGPRVKNMRDLGGYATVDGGLVRTGRVWRSAAFNTSKEKWYKPNWQVPAASRDFLTGTLGIRTDIDLRMTDEVGGATISPLGPGVSWKHIPSLAYGKVTTDEGRAAFAEVFRVFLDEGNYPIVFHCKAGRDRAGTVAFLLGALLGVDEKDLEYDWKYTWLGAGREKNETSELDRLREALLAYPGETLRDRVTAFVLSLGFTPADIGKFRSLMLGP